MKYSKFALEIAVLTLLPEQQSKKDSSDDFSLISLFPTITEKYFLNTKELDAVEITCYKIIKEAIFDTKNHGMINYGKVEFAHELANETMISFKKEQENKKDNLAIESEISPCRDTGHHFNNNEPPLHIYDDELPYE